MAATTKGRYHQASEWHAIPATKQHAKATILKHTSALQLEGLVRSQSFQAPTEITLIQLRGPL